MSVDKITCDACGKSYRWKPELVGRKVRCHCGNAIHVAADDQAAAPEAGDYEVAGSASAAARAAPALAAASQTASCPSCHVPVNRGAVICVSCGYNFAQGAQLKTQTGVVRASTGPRGKSRRIVAPDPGGFFDRLARGWEFAKISYGILWDFKQLVVFPILSAAAALLVLGSFVLPLWGTGTLAQLDAFFDDSGTQQVSPLAYILGFAFYFCTYFVIVFFNTALTACAMKVLAGEAPTLGYGLSVAVKRLPQIAAWALVSAMVGVLLKVIENLHEKAGRIISIILGTGWTVLTYFVVPVLAVEGIGPLQAIKTSWGVLRQTWGEGLLGNAAMGLISFLIALPIYGLLFAGLVLGFMSQSVVIIALAVLVFVLVAILHAAASSAADGVFKALLYNYATGRHMPADIDEDVFAGAFASRGVAG